MIMVKIYIKILSTVLLAIIMVSGLGADSIRDLNQYTTSIVNLNASIVKSDIEFHVEYIKEEKAGTFNYAVDDILYIPLKNARIIIIDNVSGEIVKSGFTDKNGIWKTNIKVNKDPRFKNKEIGSVTTITVADGFNETVHFNTTINEFDTFTSSDRIILHVINPKGRNEPNFEGARFHRFTVFEMLDYYAELMGLTRQPAFNYETPPWCPSIRGE